MRRGLKSRSSPDDEEHDVDVGGDDLLLGGIAGGAAENRLTRGRTARMRASPPVAGRSSDHPVADGGKIGAAAGGVAQPPGHARELLARRPP